MLVMILPFLPAWNVHIKAVTCSSKSSRSKKADASHNLALPASKLYNCLTTWNVHIKAVTWQSRLSRSKNDCLTTCNVLVKAVTWWSRCKQVKGSWCWSWSSFQHIAHKLHDCLTTWNIHIKAVAWWSRPSRSKKADASHNNNNTQVDCSQREGAL